MNLENRFFYRLITVMYVFSLILFILIISVILYASIPAGDIPDNTKSYIVCANGKRSIPLSDAKMEIYSYSKELNSFDDDVAKDFCTTNSAGVVTDPVMLDILNGKLPESTLLDQNYTLKISYELRNWQAYAATVFWIFIICFMIFYAIMNVIKENLALYRIRKKI